MDYTLGQSGLDVGNVKRPFYNLFWRLYQRFAQLVVILTSTGGTPEPETTTLGENVRIIKNRIGDNSTVGSTNYYLTNIANLLTNISNTLTNVKTTLDTIDTRLHGTNYALIDRSVAQWCAFINDNLRNNTIDPSTNTAYEKLTNIELQLNKLTFTGPDLNVV